MTKQTIMEIRPKNLILSYLPQSEYQSLLPYLKEVAFKRGDVLGYFNSDSNYVYFLNDGAASLSISNKAGLTLELSLIGREGVIGERAIYKHPIFNVQCQMLSKGNGYKLPSDIFQDEFYKCLTLHDLIINQLEARLLETSQTALCNHSHLIEQKLSRWLLTYADRIENDELILTHELISNLLGVHRPSISVAAQALQSKGLINFGRGQIVIINRAGLEQETCECYKAIKATVVTYLNLKRKL